MSWGHCDLNEHSVALHSGSSLQEHRTFEATRASAVQQKLVDPGAVFSETGLPPGLTLAGGPDDHIIQPVLLGRLPAECWRNHARRVDECRPKIQQNRRHQHPSNLEVFSGQYSLRGCILTLKEIVNVGTAETDKVPIFAKVTGKIPC